MTWPPLNSRRVGTGSWLGRIMDNQPRSGDTFVCGVRVVSGAVRGEGPRWRFRRSAIDRYVQDGVVTLQHGRDVALRLRLAGREIVRGRRPYHHTIRAVEVDSEAELEVSLPAGELIRFGF